MQTCLKNVTLYIVYLFSWRLWLISYACALFGVSRYHKLHSRSCRRWSMELSAIWWRYLSKVLIFVWISCHFIFVDVYIVSSNIRIYPTICAKLCLMKCGHLLLNIFSDLVKWINWYAKRLFYLFNRVFFTRHSILFFLLRYLWKEHPFLFSALNYFAWSADASRQFIRGKAYLVKIGLNVTGWNVCRW